MNKVLCYIALCIALNVNAQNSDYKEANHVKELYDIGTSMKQINTEKRAVKYEVQTENGASGNYADVSGTRNSQATEENLLSISHNYPSGFSNNESEYYSNEIIAIIFGGILVTLIFGLLIIKFWE